MHYPSSEFVIDPLLIRQYDLNGPRYTSYPTADRFVEAFGETTYRYWLANRNIGGITQPLSLYLHVPFCSDVCFYCACVGSSRVDLQACKLEYSIVSPK